MELSFGFIFSVIIIAATLAVAGYIIVQVIQTQNNANCKLYVQDLQTKINEAWGSDGSVSNVFSDNNVPSKTSQVCFGMVNQTLISEKDKPAQDALRNRVRSDSNVIFYPSTSCGSGQFSFNVQHVKTDGFFCVDVTSGKAQVKYAKGITDSVVKICPTNSTCIIGDSVVSGATVVSGIIGNGS